MMSRTLIGAFIWLLLDFFLILLYSFFNFGNLFLFIFKIGVIRQRFSLALYSTFTVVRFVVPSVSRLKLSFTLFLSFIILVFLMFNSKFQCS